MDDYRVIPVPDRNGFAGMKCYVDHRRSRQRKALDQQIQTKRPDDAKGGAHHVSPSMDLPPLTHWIGRPLGAW